MDLSQLEALEVALRRQLRWPLPGVEAQKRLSPEPREGWDPGYVPEDARPAAGLVLLYPKAGKLHTVLTLRTTALTHHGGQLSLPGGRVEKGESLVETALREAQEEIGIDRSNVHETGQLSPLYIPVSGFALHPIVALARATPIFRAEPSEVAELFEVPIERLRDPRYREERWGRHEGQRYRVPFVRIGEHQLWGATAMVVAELLEILERIER